MKHVPNLLSIFRICLVPVFIVVFLTDDSEIKLAAVVVYAVASLTDFLDGFIARRFQAISRLGKVLDPIGDKLMTVAVLTCITIEGIVPLWALVAVGVKEVTMMIGGIITHKMSGVEIVQSNIIGKTSTVVFFVVFVILILFRDIPQSVVTGLIAFAVALTFIALISYAGKYFATVRDYLRERKTTQQE